MVLELPRRHLAETLERARAAVGIGADVRRLRLWAEFLVLYVGGPLAVAFLLGHRLLIPLVLTLAALALGLLATTPGFSPRRTLRLPQRRELFLVAIFGGVTLVASLALVFVLLPERLLGLPRHDPALWALIMLLYPVLSALPQEVVFRVLFFERYGALFPSPASAVVVNGIAFGLAHLFYMNPVAILASAAGGAVFGYAYLRTRSLLLVTLLHAVAGQAIFTSGLGIYFYHGAIGQTP